MPEWSLRDLRLKFDQIGLIACQYTAYFGFRASPQDDSIVGRAGLDQGSLQSFGQHEYRGKDETHQRHSTCGKHRGQLPCPKISDAVAKQQGHGVCT